MYLCSRSTRKKCICSDQQEFKRYHRRKSVKLFVTQMIENLMNWKKAGE